MTSYMYNPSQKVTELLSRYLEFDSNQLEVAIWSGHVCLKNVNLKASAIDPLLSPSTNNKGDCRSDMNSNNPLQIHLVRGKIGMLDLKIPWKRLVWGQGDVRVKLDDVTIELGMKSSVPPPCEETTDDDGAPNDTDDQESPGISRQKKQKRLREAERRMLQGKPLGAWLRSLKKKEDEERVKMLEDEPVSLKKETWAAKKLKDTIHDFFWRFYAGLQMEVNNFRVVMIQDGIEVGLSIPKCSVQAGDTSNGKLGSFPLFPSLPSASIQRESSAGSILSPSEAPEDIVYQGAYDDGEHVDKQVIFSKVGIYVRKQAPPKEEDDNRAAMTKEYILCPMDIQYSFSLFLPLPPEKRRKKPTLPPPPILTKETKTTTPPTSHATISTGESSKKRRGKREKEDSQPVVAKPTGNSSSPEVFGLEPLKPPALPKQFSGRFKKRKSGDGGTVPTPPVMQRRRNSIINSGVDGTPMHRRRNSINFGGSSSSLSPLPNTPRNISVTLPLAQPQDMKLAVADVKEKVAEKSARIDGHLSVGIVKFVFSTRHYQLLGKLLSGAVRLRNGRPKKSIASVLDDGYAVLKRSLTVGSIDEGEGGQRLELRTTQNERESVVRAWWHYAYEAAIAEIRERKRLRTEFQKRFLSFQWGRQRYRRDEYVRFYIEFRLAKSRADDEEELLAIEDELCIEQVLLYRAIAREVHVRGGTEMPKSILEIVSAGEMKLLHESHHSASMFSFQPGMHEETAGPLGALERQCELMRMRKESKYTPPKFAGWWSWFALKNENSTIGDPDEISFATSKTTDTGVIHLLDSNILEENNTSMAFSFSARVASVELTIVEEELVPGAADTERRSTDEGSVRTGVEMSVHSEVSNLTDDQWYSRGELSFHDDDISLSDQMSSDYLIFGVPEKVLLQLDFRRMEFSVLGKTGEFTNTNFSVSTFEALGEEDARLLSIGGEDRIGSPQNALSLSVVAKKNGGSSIQCDAAIVRVWVDLPACNRCSEFISSGKPLLPSPLLSRTPREEVRLYVLRESSQTLLSRVNASIRIHGAEVTLGDVHDIACVLRSDIMELYSGTSVPSLDTSHDPIIEDEVFMEQRETVHTRSLKLMDKHAMASVHTPLSHRWVGAITAVDFEVKNQDTVMKLFSSPIDMEGLFAFQTNAVLDFSNPKLEVMTRLSPIHLILSEQRLACIRECIPQFSPREPTKEPKPLPPRLEVLSRFILLAADISIARVRIALLTHESAGIAPTATDKQEDMEDYLEEFLTVVSSFDLSFPHEEALSAAMQICIDRLAGLGMPLDEAWQASNAALLHFLEQMTQAQDIDFGQSYSAICSNILVVKREEEELRSAIQVAVETTAEEYASMIQTVDIQLMPQDVIIDCADGIEASTVQLFYDSYLQIQIPSVFAANGEGIHLLRLTSTGQTNEAIAQAMDEQSLSTAGPRRPPLTGGISFRRYEVDLDPPFGRGGLPLAILGSDCNSEHDSKRRAREQLDDLDLGELEVFVSRRLLEELMGLLASFFAPFLPEPEDETEEAHAPTDIEQHLLTVCTSSSILLVTDEFVPFCRLCLSQAVMNSSTSWNFRTDGLDLFNLSPGSEMFSTILTKLPGKARSKLHPLMIEMEGNDISIEFIGIQFVFLQKFLDEVLQLLYAEQYSILEIFDNGESLSGSSAGSSTDSSADSSDASQPSQRATAKPTGKFQIKFRDSSLLVPRSSDSSDIVALESKMITFESGCVNRSFVMPTDSTGLQIETFEQFKEDDGQRPVYRKHIRIEGARLFTSLMECQDAQDPEHPSFQYFYEIAGRASPDKHVYTERSLVDKSTISSEIADQNLAKAGRCWREITVLPISIDIITDYAPHFRILLKDPEGIKGSFALNLRLSQYCLLLSIYYSNMQELPSMFPFSAEKLKNETQLPLQPDLYPDFGSDDMLQMLLNPLEYTSEFCIVYEKISFRYTFDCYSDEGRLLGESSGSTLSLRGAALQFTSDQMGVSRCGICSMQASLTDENASVKDVLTVSSCGTSRPWANMFFGLIEDFQSLSRPLEIPLQFSIFMTPSWAMYNLGLLESQLTFSDLNPVWRLLEFVSAYATDERYRNPTFASRTFTHNIKESLRKQLGMDEKIHSLPSVTDGTDFRLWLTSPTLFVPCDPTGTIKVRADGGLWYRYTSTQNFAAQEIVSGGMTLAFAEGRQQRVLVDDLSFGVRIDTNYDNDHSDYSIQIPYVDSGGCRVNSPRLSLKPAVVAAPSICKPIGDPRRALGPRVCEVTCIVEALPRVSSAILNLFAFGQDEQNPEVAKSKEAPTSSLVARVGDIRLFALDPILGPHLPVAAVSVAAVEITMSQFANSAKLVRRPNEGAPSDFNVLANCHFWADYFKLGVTRSWEPLLEPYEVSLLMEKSKYRGTGVSVQSDSSFHVVITGAFLVVVNQVVGLYDRILRDTFGKPSRKSLVQREIAERTDPSYKLQDVVNGATLVHRKPKQTESSERVAFSLKNLTGQRIRLYRYEVLEEESAPTSVLTYLDHDRSVKLSFQASVSSIHNMLVKEVQYPAFRESSKEVVPHVVDVQVPGCNWVRDLKVDTFGRSFAAIEPRSAALRARLKSDWRLQNLMKILVEVGLEKGGRQVSVQSLFTVENKTGHDISVFCHPDPAMERSVDSFGGSTLAKSGSSFQVPTLLFLEALNQNASGLGGMWFKPDRLTENMARAFIGRDSTGAKSSSFDVHFSSRPVNLTKVVNESAKIFANNRGRDVVPDAAKSGIQLSCPVVRDSGDRLAPFCYAVEVGRSPIVQGVYEDDKPQEYAHGPILYTLSLHPPFTFVNLLPKRTRFELMHAVQRKVLWYGEVDAGKEVPVHSVGLDSPLLLLVNMGFCRTPVGEGALVHHGADQSVGLRENVGGLKVIGKAGKAVSKKIGQTLTAIGESPDKRAQGKLARARNPQLLKTTTTGKRSGQKALAGLNSIDEDIDATGGVDGKMYRVDSSVFLPQDVADETTVVDSVGQKLTLNIENVRGGGGQRRISVYCPIWIVNTTEHALRYKQENTKTFVSGTVHSPDKDGSLPISSKNNLARADDDTQDADKTTDIRAPIFSGTAGALASKAGVCDRPSEEVASLLDSNLSLEALSQLAFMFNFHEELSLGMGTQRLCFQLGDGTCITQYESDWSRGISLDSVGMSQVVTMHCKDGRGLDLTVLVYVAPEALSAYTTIVRILPRYVMVNTLPYPIRIWQDSSIFRPYPSNEASEAAGDVRWRFHKAKEDKVNQYESLWGREATLDNGLGGKIATSTAASQSANYVTTVDSSQMQPFILPDSRGERQVRFGFGGTYKLTSSVTADVAGDHVLTLTRNMDLRLLPHVSTRASPEYQVRLIAGVAGFSGELGVWFETEWGSNRRIIVKGIKKPSFAFNETDIHVGDELLRIDGAPVLRQTFSAVMTTLRTRLNEVSQYQEVVRRPLRRASMRLMGRQASGPTGSSDCQPLVLVFRTVEERLRRVRLKAAKASAMSHASTSAHFGLDGREGEMAQSTRESPVAYIRAEIKTIHHMMFVVLREDTNPPFQIQNQTFSTTIHFRQKGCNGHTWFSLKAGESCRYAWQEPLKTKRLSIRVESRTSCSIEDDVTEDGRRPSTPIKKRRTQRNKVHDEEDALFSQPISIRLEEIGSRDLLQWQDRATGSQKWFEFEVDVHGVTRVLVARDITEENDRLSRWQHYLDSLEEKIEEESRRSVGLATLNDEVFARANEYMRTEGEGRTSYDIANDARGLMADFKDASIIRRRHQIAVEVLEATGLSADAFVGDCNPYVEVKLKSAQSTGRSMFKKQEVNRTYYVRRSLNPTWESQTFVFDVPSEAVDVPRGHSISIRVRNFRSVGVHKVLGKAQVDLHSLRNQEPLTGWFPLAGRTGRRELENQLSHWGRGSIRLRVQWIYSIPAMLQYFMGLTQNRIRELQTRKDGLVEQMQQRRAAQAKKMTASDGFRAVRIRDFLSDSKQTLAGANQRISLGGKVVVKKLMAPLRAATQKDLPKAPSPNAMQRSRSRRIMSGRDDDRLFPSMHVGPAPDLARYRSGVALPKLTRLADMKSVRRLQVRPREEQKTDVSRVLKESAEVQVSLIRSWSTAYILFNDEDLTVQLDEERISASLNLERFRKPSDIVKREPIAEKLGTELRLPSTLHSFAKEHVQAFQLSRNSIDRAARRAFSAILNDGGWLTIRPIKALNLPDGYTGMFVKVRFGQDVFSTQAVDARVAPVWSSSHINGSSDKNGSSTGNLKDEVVDNSNQIRLHVSPQGSSRWVRLCVVGERGQQQLQAKSEIGIVYLPLGQLLAACIDSSDSNTTEQYIYERWFPLLSPKEAVPVEGGGGLIPRSPEQEQLDEGGFQDYYRPCIQLAISWQSDKDIDRPAERGKRRALRMAASTVKSYFKADLSRISAALIDSERSFELLSFNILDIDARYWVTSAKSRFATAVHWMQVDHQQENAKEAIALAPTPTEFFLPVIQVFAVKDNQRSAEVITFDFIDVSVAEFDVTLEERLLFDLYVFFHSLELRKSDDMIPRLENEVAIEANSPEREPRLAVLFANDFSAPDSARKIYVEQLFLGVVKFNLSYVKGKRNTWDLSPRAGHSVFRQIEEAVQLFSFHRTSDVFAAWSRQTSDEDRIAEDKGLQNLPKLFASLFPNVSDAPVRLQGKALNHVFESPFEILQSIRKFYVNETMKQIYKIIGSLDFVGNPTMLVSSVVTGFKDLVVAPSAAFMRSPTDASGVGIGVAKGTLSFFSHSTSGFFAFFTKVTATAAQFLANLSLDPEFSDWHREKIVVEATNIKRQWKKRGVRSAGYMVARPVVDVVLGVSGAAFGLVVAPAKGLRKGGTLGFCKGVAIGVSGCVVRPIVGVLDALAHISASIHDVAKSVNILEKRHQAAVRIRIAYSFGLMDVLIPYEAGAARAAIFIRKFPMKKSKRVKMLVKEIVVHVEVFPNSSGDTYAVITNTRMILVRLKKDAAGELSPTLCWELYFDEGAISSKIVDHGHSGIALNIKLTRTTSSDIKVKERPATKTLASPEFMKLSSRLVRRTVSFANGLDDDSSGDDRSRQSSDESSRDMSANGRMDVFSHSSSDSASFSDGDSWSGSYSRSYSASSGSMGDGSEGQEEDDLAATESNKEYDHYTRRGEQGEILEWFSVLAEYQFRRQLGRLHNALCCMVGDFGSIMEDPAFGGEGELSGEGYTSFGIYHFDPVDPNADAKVRGLVHGLDEIPWVSDDLFESASALPVDVQRRSVAEERSNLNYSKLLLSSEREGGVDWLVKARAWALSLDVDYISNDLPQIEESDSEASSSPTSTSASTNIERPIPSARISSAYFSPDHSLESDTEGSDEDTPPRRQRPLTTRQNLKRHPSEVSMQALTGDSNHGSQEESIDVIGDDEVRRTGMTKQASMRSIATSFASANNSLRDFAPPTLARFQTAVEEMPENEPVQDGSIASLGEPALRRRPRRRRSESPTVAPEDRLSRLENLMERLVTFSTEQVVQREVVAATENTHGSDTGTTLLRQEIRELKEEMQKKYVADDAMKQIETLRDEIARLQQRIQEVTDDQANAKAKRDAPKKKVGFIGTRFAKRGKKPPPSKAVSSDPDKS